jgi:Ca2+-binding RTX toxin-like protein
VSKGSYTDFISAVGQRESGNNYSVVATPGYLGRFQFDEGALKAIGFYNGDSTAAIDFVGTWTSKAAGYGVASKADFLASHAAQDAAILDWFNLIDSELTRENLQGYEGQTIGGVLITESGMLAGAHLAGVGGLKAFLTSGGSQNFADFNGTHVSDYLSQFGGYDTPYPDGAASGSTTTPPAASTPTPAPTPAPDPTTTTPPAASPTAGGDNLTVTAAAHEIHAGAGADTISAANYTGQTYLRGDDGADSIQGGAGFDDINGNVGADTIDGGSGGGDWLVGGKDGDRITAHAGANILYGNLGGDTLNAGSGNDLLRGGQDNDVLVGGAGRNWLSGDRGADTITGGGGADIFHTFSGAGVDVVTDFHLSEGDRVQLDHGTTYALHQSGADTVIDMGNGDSMVLQNVQMSSLTSGWIFS